MTTIRDILHRGLQKVRRALGLPVVVPDMEYLVPPEMHESLLKRDYSEVGRIFYSHQGRVIDKWAHYLRVYDQHLNRFRDSEVRVLEIGVSKGGSLELWRKYFGNRATIFGVDIDPGCASRVDPPNQVRIGSQDNPGFLRSVVTEMGGIDVVLDDGSHVGRHQVASFKVLYPLLSEGGVYIIEDLHTSYWRGFYQGGIRRRGTAIEFAKSLIDDIHGWYYRRPDRVPDVAALHIYDSILVIEKRAAARPSRVTVAQPAAD